MLEKDIEKQVLNYLHFHSIFAFKYPTTGRYSTKHRAWIKTQGTITGVSDILALLPGGNCVFIEVKTTTGRQSKNQKAFEAQVAELGFVYIVVTSVEDVIKKIGHMF